MTFTAKHAYQLSYTQKHVMEQSSSGAEQQREETASTMGELIYQGYRLLVTVN